MAVGKVADSIRFAAIFGVARTSGRAGAGGGGSERRRRTGVKNERDALIVCSTAFSLLFHTSETNGITIHNSLTHSRSKKGMYRK